VGVAGSRLLALLGELLQTPLAHKKSLPSPGDSFPVSPFFLLIPCLCWYSPVNMLGAIAFWGSVKVYKKKNLNFGEIISAMVVERTTKEVIIRLPASVDTEDLQDFLNYARYKELTSSFKIDQKEVDKLANQINTKWWTKNRNKIVK
jgi:hypothetical protein